MNIILNWCFLFWYNKVTGPFFVLSLFNVFLTNMNSSLNKFADVTKLKRSANMSVLKDNSNSELSWENAVVEWKMD